jgi:WD40 repeat protein
MSRLRFPLLAACLGGLVGAAAGEALPTGARARLGSPWFAHGSKVYSLVFTPDGRGLVTADDDNLVHLWDAATGKELRRFEGHEKWVRCAAVSPDGKTIASGGGDHSVRLWDAATGRERHRLSGHQDAVFGVSFSPDGKTLASAGLDSSLRLWDVATGREVSLLQAHTAPAMATVFAPDGKTLASAGHDSTIRIWDTATGRELRTLNGHKGGVGALAFSPNGKVLASGGEDGTVRLWDAAAGTETRRSTSHGSSVLGLAFSPDGKRLASASLDRTIRLYEPATGDERRLEAALGEVVAVAFTPDGREVAAQGLDHALHFWRADTGREMEHGVGRAGPLTAVAFLGDGKRVLTGGEDGALRLWDAATGTQLRLLGKEQGPIAALGLAPDNKALVAVRPGVEIHLRDLAAGTARPLLPPPPRGLLLPVAFSADGKLLAGRAPEALIVWDFSTGKEVRRLEGEGEVTALALSPDGRVLAWGDSQGNLGLWRPATDEVVGRFEGPPTPVEALAFTPNGRMLIAANEKKVRLWELATRDICDGFTGHSNRVLALACSRDGRSLVSASADGTGLIWDLYAPVEPPRTGPPSAEDLQGLWDELAGRDAARGRGAIKALVAAPRQAVPLLRQKLNPVSTAESRKIARLIADLDADEFAVRERATAELEELGETATEALRRAVAGTSQPEVRRRGRQLLEKLEGKTSPERIRTFRALDVLEQIDQEDARDVLRALGQGAKDVWLTEEARATLERLARRTSPLP